MKKRIWIPQAIAALALAGAFRPGNPYSYYVLLRWICFPVFVGCAWLAATRGRPNLAWLMGIFAALFNPFLPVHLSRGLWEIIDLTAAGTVIF